MSGTNDERKTWLRIKNEQFNTKLKGSNWHFIKAGSVMRRLNYYRVANNVTILKLEVVDHILGR